jgi:hypothetical protein
LARELALTHALAHAHLAAQLLADDSLDQYHIVAFKLLDMVYHNDIRLDHQYMSIQLNMYKVIALYNRPEPCLVQPHTAVSFSGWLLTFRDGEG